MPTVKRIDGYRFFFFSNEGNEPPHIHIESGDGYAKFWLSPVELNEAFGFNSTELNKIRKLVIANQKEMLGEWHEYFNQK